jgi:hypothetical protein
MPSTHSNQIHKYHKLNEDSEYIQQGSSDTALNKTINTIGVVIAFQLPKPSSGKNRYMATYSLIDDSCKSVNHPVVLILFSNEYDYFLKDVQIGKSRIFPSFLTCILFIIFIFI